MTYVQKLEGGLGNQLFQYFKAADFCLDMNCELILDFKDVYLGKVLHGSLISSIQLPVEFKRVNENPNRLKIIRGRALKSLQKRLSVKFESSVENYSIEVPDSQDLKFYDRVSRKFPGWSATLVSESEWFKKLRSLAHHEEFIAIHIRRGDYTHARNAQTIGLLDFSYYIRGLDLLRSRLGNLPVWVFSDDPEYILGKIHNLPKKSRIIVAPENSDPAETLLLMSLAKGFVLSNSTFSWWSACFSHEDSVKVVPTPWFRNLPQPISLIPASWEGVTSVWENDGG